MLNVRPRNLKKKNGSAEFDVALTLLTVSLVVPMCSLAVFVATLASFFVAGLAAGFFCILGAWRSVSSSSGFASAFSAEALFSFVRIVLEMPFSFIMRSRASMSPRLLSIFPSAYCVQIGVTSFTIRWMVGWSLGTICPTKP